MFTRPSRFLASIIVLGFLGAVPAPGLAVGGASIEELIEQLKKDDTSAQKKAVRALFDKGRDAKPALPALFELLEKPKIDANLQADTYRAVERIGLDKSHVPGLLEKLRDAKGSYQIYTKLLAIAGEPALNPVLAMVDDTDPKMRTKALAALMGNRSVSARNVPQIAKCLRDSDPKVSQQAAGTLSFLGVEAKDAIPDLITAVEKKNVFAANALAKMGPLAKDAVPTLRAALKDNTTFEWGARHDKSDIGKVIVVKVFLAEMSAKALGSIGTAAEATLPELQDAAKDHLPSVRLEAVRALGLIGSPKAIPQLLALFDKVSPAKDELGMAAAKAIADIGEPALPDLLKANKGTKLPQRMGAAFAIAQIRPVPPDAVALLRPYLKAAAPEVRAGAIGHLGQMGADAKDVIPDLVAMLSDKVHSELVRQEIATALGEIGEPAVPAILECAKHKSAVTRRWSAVILGKMKSPPGDAVPTLARLLSKDPESEVRTAAAKALGEFGPDADSVVSVLQQSASTDRNMEVRNAAFEALKKIKK